MKCAVVEMLEVARGEQRQTETGFSCTAGLP